LFAALVTTCGVSVQAQAQMVPYALGKLPAGFTIHWPNPPKITRSVDVKTIGDFNKAAATPGTLITVKGHVAGSGNISASDIEVHMDDGASLDGLTIARAVKRIALVGGTYNGTIEMSIASQFYPTRADNPAWIIEDMMIDGVHARSTSGTALFVRGTRVAVLNSFLHGADYGIWGDSINQNLDVIVANNQIEAEGRQATVRFVSVNHLVAVDNRFTDLLQTGEKHNFRIHGTSDNVFAARNELVNSGTMIATMPDDSVGHVWFENNTFHHKTPDLFNMDRTQLHVLDAHNNVAYTNVWSCFYCGSAPSGWSVGGNTIKPYTNPPAAK
jgi:hypothetical protein